MRSPRASKSVPASLLPPEVEDEETSAYSPLSQSEPLKSTIFECRGARAQPSSATAASTQGDKIATPTSSTSFGNPLDWPSFPAPAPPPSRSPVQPQVVSSSWIARRPQLKIDIPRPFSSIIEERQPRKDFIAESHNHPSQPPYLPIMSGTLLSENRNASVGDASSNPAQPSRKGKEPDRSTIFPVFRSHTGLTDPTEQISPTKMSLEVSVKGSSAGLQLDASAARASTEHGSFAPPSSSASPTAFEQVNAQHGFKTLHVNQMLAPLFADEYSHSVHDWCIHGLKVAAKDPVPLANDTIHILGLNSSKIEDLRKHFVAPTSSLDRSSIIDNQGVLKGYLNILFRRTNLIAGPLQVPGLLKFCQHMANYPNSLSTRELDGWNSIIAIHTGLGMHEIVQEFS
jgi:hypothetical protein